MRETLCWAGPPAENAGSHNVYLGTSLDDVNNATTSDASGILASEGQADATYEPANFLAYGRTYYWRIDEVNAVDGTVSKGDVWSFTVEPFAYVIENVTATASSSQEGMGPENTVDGVGLDAAGSAFHRAQRHVAQRRHAAELDPVRVRQRLSNCTNCGSGTPTS